MTAPLAPNAPYNDFTLLKTLLDYSRIHLAISNAASEKLANHLWYLSEDLIALVFFDNNVPAPTKRLMIRAMRETEGKDITSKADYCRPRFVPSKEV